MSVAPGLKVWHVANGFGYAGTERAAETWCHGLKARGWSVRAYALGQDGPRSRSLGAGGVPARVLGADPAGWGRELRRQGCDVLHVHRHGERDERFDALTAAARRHGSAIVETNVFGERRRLFPASAPDVMGFMSVFCLWRYVGWPVSLAAGTLESHAVLYNPLDRGAFIAPAVQGRLRRQARRDWGLAHGDLVVGRLGRPDPNKWPVWLMGALASARRCLPNLKIVMMGAPPAQVEVARRLGLQGSVRFLPPSAEQAQVDRYYAAIDVLAHGSRVGESFGSTLAEAAAAGRPVVVDSTPWADNAQVEVVEHGVTGLVAGRPGAFVQALLRLQREPGLRDHLGREARRRARRFAAAPLLDHLEGVYARALRHRRAPTAELRRLAARPLRPGRAMVEGFGADYPSRLARREAPRPGLDRAWALHSTLRLYWRGWLSRGLKFWRWGR